MGQPLGGGRNHRKRYDAFMKSKNALPGDSELRLKIKAFGPSQKTLDEIGRLLLRLPEVKKHLKKTRSRLLSVVPIDTEQASKSERPPAPPIAFRATIYDYTNNRTLFLDGRLAQPKK